MAPGKARRFFEEQITIEAAKNMFDILPMPMDEEATQMAFPVDYNESMNTLLCQEQVKFNKLLSNETYFV